MEGAAGGSQIPHVYLVLLARELAHLKLDSEHPYVFIVLADSSTSKISGKLQISFFDVSGVQINTHWLYIIKLCPQARPYLVLRAFMGHECQKVIPCIVFESVQGSPAQPP